MSNANGKPLYALAQRLTDADPAAARALAGYLAELADGQRAAYAVSSGCGVVMRWNPHTERVDFDSATTATPNE